MTDLFIYALIFLPVLTPLLVVLSNLSSKKIWLLSVILCGLNFLGFAGLFSLFLTNAETLSKGVLTEALPWSANWGIQLQFRLDFLSVTLGLAISLVFVLTMLIARAEFERGRAKLAALNIFYISMIGLVCASDFPLATVFLTGLILPELLLLGWDKAPGRVSTLKKHAFAAVLSAGFCLICVLAFSKTFVSNAPHWFLFSGAEYELSFRHLTFLIFCVAVFLRVPMFPFQSRLGCVYRLESLETLLPFIACSNVGFYLLFRYGPVFFAHELLEYGSVLAGLATLHIIYSIVYLAKNKGHREHIYGTQQLWNGLLLLGFVSFGSMGWVGAWSLYISEILVITLALLVAIVLERRKQILSPQAVLTAPGYATATSFGTLALFGAPLTAAFYSLVLILWSGMSQHRFATMPVILALPIWFWVGVRRMFFQFSGSNTVAMEECRELDKTEAFVIFSICALLLIWGLYPDLLMHPIGEQLDRVLASSPLGGGNK